MTGKPFAPVVASTPHDGVTSSVGGSGVTAGGLVGGGLVGGGLVGGGFVGGGLVGGGFVGEIGVGESVPVGVGDGVGVGLITQLHAREFGLAELTEFRASTAHLARPLWVLTHEDNRRSPRIAAVRTAIAEALEARC